MYVRYVIDFKDCNITQENNLPVVGGETKILLFELHHSAHDLLL